MKTGGFIMAACVLISISLSAQTKQESKPDSIKIGYSSFQKTLNDTLKLENPFKENSARIPNRKYNFPQQNPNLALNYRFGHPGQTYKMPVLKPDFKSNMPVMKPDSSVHYFIQIKKTGK